MKQLIIMRGLPSCGKSYRAKELAGKDGMILSTDEYWYKVNQPELPETYSYDPKLASVAHAWNQERAAKAMADGHPLIIIDNTNVNLRQFCCGYLIAANNSGYSFSIEEPTSQWWVNNRDLFRDKWKNRWEIFKLVKNLYLINEDTHKVPFQAFMYMVENWEEIPKNPLQYCAFYHNLNSPRINPNDLAKLRELG